jgi:hypothetical protein
MPQKEMDNKILQSTKGKTNNMEVKEVVTCIKNFGGKLSDPCVYMVCSFMCRFVTFYNEKAEIFITNYV